MVIIKKVFKGVPPKYTKTEHTKQLASKYRGNMKKNLKKRKLGITFVHEGLNYWLHVNLNMKRH